VKALVNRKCPGSPYFLLLRVILHSGKAFLESPAVCAGGIGAFRNAAKACNVTSTCLSIPSTSCVGIATTHFARRRGTETRSHPLLVASRAFSHYAHLSWDPTGLYGRAAWDPCCWHALLFSQLPVHFLQMLRNSIWVSQSTLLNKAWPSSPFCGENRVCWKLS